MNATPHVAQNTNGRASAIDGRTTRHAGYAVSQRIRKRIEEVFGWVKTVAGQAKNQIPRARTRRLGLHLRGRRLQSGAAAEASGRRMSAAANCRLHRPLADRRGRPLGPRLPRPLRPGDPHDHAQGGEIAFGALEASLDVAYARDSIDFSLGTEATKATKSRAREPPNCSTTARLRSNFPTTMATTPSSKPNARLLQQPARGQVLHGSATTTEAVRRAIQHSQESLRALSDWGCRGQAVPLASSHSRGSLASLRGRRMAAA